MNEHADESARTRLPIEQLPLGEVAPPLELDHESWPLLAGWDDPLAPRGGCRLPSGKTRIDYDGVPAIEWMPDNATERPPVLGAERALTTGEPTWREYTVECRLQALETHAGPTNDGWFIDVARAGIIFRAETIRRHYYFCLEAQRRLVLYRRIDDEWFELAARDVDYLALFDYNQPGRIVTLRVELDGDGIRAMCPELDVAFRVTDATIRSGKVGFRALGACRLFDLTISMTASQERVNQRLADRLHRRRQRLSATVAPEEQVAEIELPEGYKLVQACDFYRPGRNDLLLRGPEGLLATSFDGQELWHLADTVKDLRVTGPTADGSRRIYALVGEQRADQVTTVRGREYLAAVADEIISIDATTGKTIGRTKLPDDPHVDQVQPYLFSIETGRLTSDHDVDFVLRHCRQDMEGGGKDLWAFDGDLNLLWHQTVSPPYGHGGAVHLVDLDGSGRSEVVAGGTIVAADGDILSVHDMTDEMARIWGAGHYDAVVAGNLADDPERDPVLFLVAGSAGVYVVNPFNGRTRAVHCVGHAQWGKPCKVRDDMPGRQVMVGTRWNNFGILTLFSGIGDRLWSIQPDYVIEGTMPVQWDPQGPQHIWVNTSRDGQGLYDGEGRLVLPLDSIRQLWAEGVLFWDVATHVVSRSPDSPDLLGVQVGRRLMLFGPAT